MGIFSVTSMTLAGQQINLEDDAIVCFVGQNSSGKSTALKSIHNSHGRNHQVTLSHIEECKSEVKEGSQYSEEMKNYLCIDVDKIINKKDKTYTQGGTIVDNFLKKRQIPHSHKGVFISSLDLQTRLSALINGQMVNKGGDRPATALQWIAQEPKIEAELSAVIKRLFGFELSLCAGAASQMTLHTGNRIDPSPYGGDRSQAYFNKVAELPAVTEEGDGAKCAIGLLAACISRDSEIYLVDEPDLYLHPPQAYEVAKTLADILKEKQVFVATHSARFIQGLADAAKDRLVLIRLERDGRDASMHVVENNVFADVKADPILAFTNFLDGFFHSQVIFCEDEADCLFYRATAHRIIGEESFKNALWLGVNGKAAFKKTAAIAKRMKVPFKVIADFDILKNVDDVAPLLEAKDIDPSHYVSEINWLHRQVQNDNKVEWRSLKENGLRAFAHDMVTYDRIKKLLQDLNCFGLIINKFGEVEHLREPKLSKKGAECIGSMLAEELENDHEYNDLRKFWEEIKNQAVSKPKQERSP